MRVLEVLRALGHENHKSRVWVAISTEILLDFHWARQAD